MQSISHNPDGSAESRPEYGHASASISVGGLDPTTDITTLAGFETLFDQFQSKTAHKVYIGVGTGQTAHVRFNSLTSPKITVTGTNPYPRDGGYTPIACDKIYVAGNADLTVDLH